jgi:S-adenosylmethionine:tRNA ribosyltransferase-isomerase
MQLSDFNYDLPPELIAQHPQGERVASRLLHLQDGQLADRQFSDISQLLRPGDLLVLNNTRVMRARLFGHKESGGRVEIMLERLLSDTEALAQIRASKSPRPGTWLLVGNEGLLVSGREGDFYRLRAESCRFETLMQRSGHLPLPPYIRREDGPEDDARYQTVFAARDGAVAAPTAGLHFDQVLLERLKDQGVELAEITLHVGAGTFAPVRVADISQHQMHSEWLEVPEQVCEQVTEVKAKGGRVVAVGTTAVRSLETAAASGRLQPFVGETRIFITPGYGFRAVDALITNFHLPESTLLMLVSAFAGYENTMAAYRHAIEQRYRFFSYGDAMFIEPE